jgi:hypothetical protein
VTGRPAPGSGALATGHLRPDSSPVPCQAVASPRPGADVNRRGLAGWLAGTR